MLIEFEEENKKLKEIINLEEKKKNEMKFCLLCKEHFSPLANSDVKIIFFK